jgi:hypothetical protein
MIDLISVFLYFKMFQVHVFINLHLMERMFNVLGVKHHQNFLKNFRVLVV